MRNSLSSTDQPGDGLAGFVDLVVGDATSDAYRILDAGTEVVVQQREGERLERFGDRGDLGEDVDAVLVVCNHLLQAADLALDAAQPVEVRGLGLVSARRGDFSHVTHYTRTRYESPGVGVVPADRCRCPSWKDFRGSRLCSDKDRNLIHMGC